MIIERTVTVARVLAPPAPLLVPVPVPPLPALIIQENPGANEELDFMDVDAEEVEVPVAVFFLLSLLSSLFSLFSYLFS